MSQVTLQILAKELGLSIATVSKALRDSHEISAGTKERVLQRAKALSYIPNPYASSLRRKKSNTIAVVIPEVADSFFSLAIKGIEEIAQLKGYHTLIYLTYESYEREKKILEDCKNGRVDGVLMSVSSETRSAKHIEDLMAHEIPVVFFDRAIEKIPASKIITDDFESAFRATTHLIECNCRNLVYLSISNILDMNNHRMEGFKKAVRDHHLPCDDNNIVNCFDNPDESKMNIRKLLKNKKRPDGILASVEKLVIPTYLICAELGISIPSQLKFICFSTNDYVSILKPALTTVTQPATEIGKQAAMVLFKALGKKSSVGKMENIVVPSSLHIRESTGVKTESTVFRSEVTI